VRVGGVLVVEGRWVWVFAAAATTTGHFDGRWGCVVGIGRVFFVHCGVW
jgi:hypothetical protein